MKTRHPMGLLRVAREVRSLMSIQHDATLRNDQRSERSDEATIAPPTLDINTGLMLEGCIKRLIQLLKWLLLLPDLIYRTTLEQAIEQIAVQALHCLSIVQSTRS